MTEAVGRSLLQRASRGGIWLIAGRGYQSIVRLISNVILARLLIPEAFGLMALVMVLLTGLELLSDTGARPSIVRSARGEDPLFLSTAWTIQVVRGVILFLICWLVAGPYARLYDEPQLATVLPWAGLIALCSGLRSTKLFLADRQLRQGRQVFLGLIAQSVGPVVTITWAWHDASVRALVAGTIAGAGTYALLSHWAMPGPRNRFLIHRESARELFGFGRWIFLSTLLHFFAHQGDRFFLGLFVATGPLGLYFIATMIPELVTMVLGMLASSIALPVWSESHRSDAARQANSILNAHRAFCAVGMAGIAAVCTLVPALIRLFYDDQYHDVILFTQLLCIPAWFQVLKFSTTQFTLAVGNPRAQTYSNAVLFLVRIPASIGGFYLYGLPGFILGSVVGGIVGLFPLYLASEAHGLHLRANDAKATLRAALICSAGVWLPPLLAGPDGFDRLGVEGLLAAILVLIALAPARALLLKLRP